jgi:hypothetical protein
MILVRDAHGGHAPRVIQLRIQLDAVAFQRERRGVRPQVYRAETNTTRDICTLLYSFSSCSNTACVRAL